MALIMAIDASTTKCGVAVFADSPYTEVRCARFFTEEFPGSYSEDKLREIVMRFSNLFGEYNPQAVLIEEPLVFAKQSRSVAMLNQVGGALFALCVSRGTRVGFLHGQKVKKILKIRSKRDSIELAYNNLMLMDPGVRMPNEHEADAINLFYAQVALQHEIASNENRQEAGVYEILESNNLAERNK